MKEIKITTNTKNEGKTIFTIEVPFELEKVAPVDVLDFLQTYFSENSAKPNKIVIPKLRTNNVTKFKKISDKMVYGEYNLYDINVTPEEGTRVNEEMLGSGLFEYDNVIYEIQAFDGCYPVFSRTARKNGYMLKCDATDENGNFIMYAVVSPKREKNKRMDEEDNHEKEIRKIHEDFVKGNYEHWREINNNKNKKKKFIIDEKPTIPTLVGPIKNYSHKPLD